MFSSQITDFLRNLGYAPDEAIYIRLLPAKGFQSDSPEHRALFPQLAYEREHRNGAKVWVPSNKNLKLHDGALIWQCKKGDRPITCSDPWEWIQAQSQRGFCPYIVVNPGGQNKREITTGRVIFWEHDELDKPTQIERFMEYADRWGGAMAVETRSSIHCYIRLDQELPPNLIQPTLKRVIALMGSDPSVNDECRLMRIPGFDHIKMVDTPSGWQAERFPITLLHSWDGTFASWDEIDRELPTEAPKFEPKPAPKPSTLSTVSDAGISEILANDILPRLSVEQIFSWTGHDFHEDSSGKLKGNCPWHDSQSGTSFWVTPSQDGGTHTGACPTCTDNKKLNPIAYRYALRTNNPQAGQPTGRDFIDVVEELAADAGVQLPRYESESRNNAGQSKAAGPIGAQEPTAETPSDNVIQFPGTEAPEIIEREDVEAIFNLASTEADVETLFPTLYPALIAKAERFGVPVEAIVGGLLPVCASLLHNKTELEIEPGYSIPPMLWCGVVGGSGAAKTPVLQVSAKPLQKWQMALYKKHELDMADYEIAFDSWTKSGKEKGEPKPEEPIMRSLYTSDFTIEAVVKMCVNNAPNGLLVHVDELKGFFKSFGEYKGGGGSDRQKWLSSHSGLPVKTDRKGSQTLMVERANVSIAGSIQPSVLRRLMGEEDEVDGLWARILWFSIPDSEMPAPGDVPAIDISEYLRGIYSFIDYTEGNTFCFNLSRVNSPSLGTSEETQKWLFHTSSACGEVLDCGGSIPMD